MCAVIQEVDEGVNLDESNGPLHLWVMQVNMRSTWHQATGNHEGLVSDHAICLSQDAVTREIRRQFRKFMREYKSGGVVVYEQRIKEMCAGNCCTAALSYHCCATTTRHHHASTPAECPAHQSPMSSCRFAGVSQFPCHSLSPLLFYLVHVGNKESLDVSFMELSKRAPTLAVYVAGHKAFP